MWFPEALQKQARWHLPAILALERCRQEDSEVQGHPELQTAGGQWPHGTLSQTNKKSNSKTWSSSFKRLAATLSYWINASPGMIHVIQETEAPEYSSRENSPQPRTSDSKWESIISPRHFFQNNQFCPSSYLKDECLKNMVQEIRAGLAIITVICQRQCMVWKITSCISKRIRVQFIFHLPNIDILASPKRRLKRSDKASEIEQHNRLHRRWFKPFAVC